MSDTSAIWEVKDEPEKGAEIDRVQAVWRRRKWLVILVFALPCVAAASVIFSLPGLYRSTATVLVERQQVPESFVRTTVTSELETRLQTISQEILSRSRLQSLIERFNLYPALRNRLPNEEVVERLRRDIQLELRGVDRRRGATVAFAISYKGFDPQTVAIVTNTLASFYIEENLKARERQAAGTTQFLKAQISETEKRLEEQERRLSEFRRQYLGELPQQMQGNLAALEAINTQLRLNSDNQVRAAQRRESLVSQLADAESSTQALPTPGAPPPAPDPLALHLARLKQDLTAAQTRYTDAHPTVTRLKDEIAAVERKLESAKPDSSKTEVAAVVGKLEKVKPNPNTLRLRETLQAAEADLKMLKLEGQRLHAAFATYQARVENTPRREQELLDISRDYEATKEQHQTLLKRYGEAQLAESMEQRQKGEQFRLLDPAVPSGQPAAPNRSLMLAIVVLLSLGAAAGAAVLAEMRDTSFHSVDELRAFTKVPVLVSIPWITTESGLHRQQRRFRLAAMGAALALTLVVGASYFIAHGNEQLVRILDRSA